MTNESLSKLLDGLFDTEKLYTIEGKPFGKDTVIYWSLNQIKAYTSRVLHPYATHEMVMQFICSHFTDVEGFKRSESNLKNLDYLWQTDYNKLPPVAKVVTNYILEAIFDGFDPSIMPKDIITDFCDCCEIEEYSIDEGDSHISGWTDFQDLMLYDNYNVHDGTNVHHLFIELLNEVMYYQCFTHDLDNIKNFCTFLKQKN